MYDIFTSHYRLFLVFTDNKKHGGVPGGNMQASGGGMPMGGGVAHMGGPGMNNQTAGAQGGMMQDPLHALTNLTKGPGPSMAVGQVPMPPGAQGWEYFNFYILHV